MSIARWLAAAALLLALVLSAAIVVLRDHPAAEHTRSFREEDKAARALLVALRSGDAKALDDAKKLLGDRNAWITVHDRGAHRTVATANAADIARTLDADDVVQVDVGLRAP